MKAKRRIIVIAAAALVAAVFALALVASSWVSGSQSGGAASGSTTIPQPSLVKLKKLTRSRIAPESQRVDLAGLGGYNGKPWRAETTLLPDTRTVEWQGQQDPLFDARRSGNWNAAAGTAQPMNPTLGAQVGEVPQRIYNEVNNALDSINRAVRARRARQGSVAALDAAQASLDLQLRHRPKAEANVSRFGLWAHQLQVDAAAGESGAVTGDLAILEWVRDRIPQPTT